MPSEFFFWSKVVTDFCSLSAELRVLVVWVSVSTECDWRKDLSWVGPLFFKIY